MYSLLLVGLRTTAPRRDLLAHAIEGQSVADRKPTKFGRHMDAMYAQCIRKGGEAKP